MKNRKSAGRITLRVCLGLSLVSVALLGYLNFKGVKPLTLTTPARAQDVSDFKEARKNPARNVFPKKLRAVVDPSAAETAVVEDLLLDGDEANRGEAADRVTRFLADNPGSAYAPDLHNQLGNYFKSTGRFTRALNHWRTAWESAKEVQNFEGIQVADEALAHLTLFLASLGKEEQVAVILAEQSKRVLYNSSLQTLFRRGQEKYARIMAGLPSSRKCGVFALISLAQADGSKNVQEDNLRNSPVPSMKTGYSLADLRVLGNANGFPVKAVKLTAGLEHLPVPSVVHWKQDHYGAIIGTEGEFYVIKDPTTGGYFKMLLEEVLEESTGYFLVPSGSRLEGLSAISDREAGQIFGKSSLCPPDDLDDGCPPPVSGTCPTCKPRPGGGGAPGNAGPNGGCTPCEKSNAPRRPRGMPYWEVSEPYINLWIKDVPLSHQPAKGPKVELELQYKLRDFYPIARYMPIGRNWSSTWEGVAYNGVAFLPGGIRDSFGNFSNNKSQPSLLLNAVQEVLKAGEQVVGYVVYMPDGDQYRFEQPEPGNFVFKLSKIIDVHGEALTFVFDSLGRIQKVVDAGAGETIVSYNGDGYVSTVSAMGGTRVVQFGHAEPFILTSIQDVEGIASSFQYGEWWDLISMITPYGTSSFSYNWGTYDRRMLVTEPDGAKHHYVFLDDMPAGANMPDFTSVHRRGRFLILTHRRGRFLILTHKAMGSTLLVWPAS